MKRKNNTNLYGAASGKKTSMSVLLLNIVIIVSALVLVISIVNLVDEVQYYRTGYYSETSSRYRIEDDEFGRLAADYIDNDRAVEEITDEPEYVARYMLDAYFYKANADAGDTVLADRYRTKMDEARSHLGTYQAAADRIDAMLEIE